MRSETPARPSRILAFGLVIVCGAFLAACTSSEPRGVVHRKTVAKSKEYFSEAEYGVKASPRVSDKRTRLPRGGGRDQLGKPYKVKGKWYYPKEDRGYKKVGAASWYGDAFHGRLTANGEIYDMTHLTAAHPTMPLPSYARVTNMKNGASVIVRVNDRGPYAHGRIIDLSKRAAQMLDYTHTGVAKVKVEYVGRAPLDGHDDQYLLASYRPNGVQMAPDPSDGLPAGVMVAMDGRTPTARVGGGALVAAAFSGVQRPKPVMREPVAYDAELAIGDPVLPDYGPIFPERPSDGFYVPETQTAFAVMSYADQRVKASADPFAALLDGKGMSADDIVASWKRTNAGTATTADYVAAGSFASQAEADAVAMALARFGRASIEQTQDQGATWYLVSLQPAPGVALDTVLETAWANGAPDAMAVRQ